MTKKRGPYRKRDWVDRFWSHVDKSGDCWEWTAGRVNFGYGQFAYSPTESRRAHRVSWELVNGPIPDGLCVLHRCDNPPCVRPEHLFLGDASDNAQDKSQKGRCRGGAGIGGYGRGEDTYNHKMTDKSVRQLRADRKRGMLYRELAEKYGVSVPTAHGVVARTVWKHVLDEEFTA